VQHTFTCGTVSTTFVVKPANYPADIVLSGTELQVGSTTAQRLTVTASPSGTVLPTCTITSTPALATVTVDAECVVYPAPWDGPLDPAFGMARDAAEGDQIEGPGADDFSGLDAYAPGDDRRRIAWKASSRGQGLMTKAFHGLYGQTLLLDWDRLGPGPAEEKLSRLCAMVIQASGRNTDYGLRLGPTRIEPGRGEVHKHTCLAALALSPEGLGP